MDAWSDAPEVQEPTPAQPLFCVRCRREGPRDARVCPDCGDALCERGYCPVCENLLPLPIGAQCPKHDLELTEPPPSPDEFNGADAPRWVTIATFADFPKAEATRLRLEAEGIPTFLDGERMNAIYSVATGGAKLQVPEPLVNDARILLNQTWSPPVHDELDDAWDELAPAPGEAHQGLITGIALVVVLVLIVPMALVVIAKLLR